MHAFRFTAEFVTYLVGAKLLMLAGGFFHSYLLNTSDGQQVPPLFWVVGGALFVANIVLFAFWAGGDKRQQLVLWLSLIIDLLAVSYLLALPQYELLALLVGLGLISGFYGMMLPHNGGVAVGLACILIYALFVILGVSQDGVAMLMYNEGMAILSLGVPVLAGVALLARRMQRSLEAVYGTSEDLTLDLTRHAIEAELSNEELLERNQEVSTLLQIVENFVAALEFEELFARVVKAFRNRFVFDKFTLYLYNPEDEVLELRLEAGGEHATGIAKAVKSGEGMVGWSFQHGEGVLISDVRKDERFKEFNPRTRRLRALACQPLVYRGENLGVLCLDSEKPGSFDDSTFGFLERVAPLISICVSNSMNYSMAKAQSRTDNLTGLSNHRGFVEQFLPMLEDAFTDGYSLVMIMIDIDHFKQVNDTYGHLVGNLILAELADILKKFFRGSDLVARFGGEEFVVVLNGTRPDIAPRIAEQLRRKIETHQFPISLQRDEFKQVTVSLGLASTGDGNLSADIARGSRDRTDEADEYLRNAEDICEQLIENADQALYAAKREGRNLVMLSMKYPVPPPEQPIVNLQR